MNPFKGPYAGEFFYRLPYVSAYQTTEAVLEPLRHEMLRATDEDSNTPLHLAASQGRRKKRCPLMDYRAL